MTTQFSQQLLKAAKDGAVVFDDVKELDGMSSEQIGAASEAAKARKLDGKWLITLQNTTTQAVLENLKNRATREKIYRASIGRAQIRRRRQPPAGREDRRAPRGESQAPRIS